MVVVVVVEEEVEDEDDEDEEGTVYKMTTYPASKISQFL